MPEVNGINYEIDHRTIGSEPEKLILIDDEVSREVPQEVWEAISRIAPLLL